jgi:hypothetical protein
LSGSGALASVALGLDLPDALSRHRKLLADLFQRVVGIHADAKAHAQHALLARRQERQHARGSLAQWMAASIGRIAFLSSMKSPTGMLLVNWERYHMSRLYGPIHRSLQERFDTRPLV